MRVLFVLFTMLAAATAATAGDPGDSGLLSMRLGVGARNGAMAETGAATTTDANAIYWNPGGLAYLEGTDLSFQHMEYFGLFRSESLTLGHRTEFGTLGLLVNGFYSDELERTAESPAGVSQGTFQPYDFVAGVAYAHQIGEFGVGATVKMVYERIDVSDGLGVAFDLGVMTRTRVDGLTLGAAFSHLGSDFSLDGGEKFPLPAVVRAGFAYSPPQLESRGWGRAQIAGDVLLPNDGNGRIHAGVEYLLHESFALRAGQRFNYETASYSFGAGFSRSNLRVDYAFLQSENDIDATHRFSVGFTIR